jgi:streptogramin lyase
MPVAGGTPTPLINGQSIHAIAVDDTHVYWTDDIGNRIVRMPVAGGATVVVASNQATPSEIAIDDKNIYWVNSTSNGAVLKLAK